MIVGKGPKWRKKKTLHTQISTGDARKVKHKPYPFTGLRCGRAFPGLLKLIVVLQPGDPLLSDGTDSATSLRTCFNLSKTFSLIS